jgi:lipopolysaccharide export system permease protein
LNLIQRYIFVQVAMVSAAAVCLLTLLLVAANALRELVPLLADGRIDAVLFIQGLLLLAPYVATYSLPGGMLVGILIVLGRLSAQNEITALRSAGFGLRRISAPILLLALAGVVISTLNNVHYGPNARANYRLQLAQSIQTNPQNFLVQRTFIREFPGYVLYFGEREGGNLRDVWVWVLDNQRRVVQFVRARHAELNFDENTFAFILTLRDAQAEIRQTENPESFVEAPYLPSASEVTLQLPLGRFFGGADRRMRVTWLNLPQLIQELSRVIEQERVARETGGDVLAASRVRMRVQFEIQERFVMAFAVLGFALIAIPLGFKFRRKETSANLGIALVLGLAYYLMIIMIGWLVKIPDIRPDLLLWLPNFVFQGIGGWLLLRLR